MHMGYSNSIILVFSFWYSMTSRITTCVSELHNVLPTYSLQSSQLSVVMKLPL